LASALSDAQVDLNPHQIEAALFAFRSPLSKGAILADEVGLGKTIEAGILLAQNWAERRRNLLVICPASLRKQWSQELADKFFLPSVILETKTFNESIRAGNPNPFQQPKIIHLLLPVRTLQRAIRLKYSLELDRYRRGPPPAQRLQTGQ
jgi:SNF2 family DNA or RNA helicase